MDDWYNVSREEVKTRATFINSLFTMVLLSLHFRNSIHNTNGILFNSQLFLEDIGAMQTIKEFIWTRLEANLE